MTKDTKLNQLIEIWAAMERGEWTREGFLKAFYYRFGEEIRRLQQKEMDERNFGWADIDWNKVEAHPLLQQLLPELNKGSIK